MAPPLATLWQRFEADAAPALAAFEANLQSPRQAQERRLAALVEANAATEFGRRHNFAGINSFEAYRQHVPVADWQSFEPWITRAANAEVGVLTADQPLFFERTSGSSAASKLIPYTAGLLHEFQSAIVVWLAALYRDCPGVAAGRSYWALSPPATAADVAASGVAVGSASDAQYLAGSVAEPLFETVLDTSHATLDIDRWRLLTLAAMVEATDLSMISVWSPTFVTALLAPLRDADGAVFDWLSQHLAAKRFVALQDAIGCADGGGFAALWPELAVMSCWMDGPSAGYAAALERQFPQATFTPKGLLATEAVVSIPWGTSGLCPVAVESHVFEFLDGNDAVHLVDELRLGERYRPLLSTAGGLYRYALGDVVEVVDVLADTPCIRFVGRSDVRSDLAGEKLDEDLVRAAIRDVTSRPAFVVPAATAQPPHYLLVVEASPVPEQAQSLARAVEHRLQEVFHYANARRLGQLGPMQAVEVGNAAAFLQGAWESVGRRAGDAKASALVTNAELARALCNGLIR